MKEIDGIKVAGTLGAVKALLVLVQIDKAIDREQLIKTLQEVQSDLHESLYGKDENERD